MKTRYLAADGFDPSHCIVNNGDGTWDNLCLNFALENGHAKFNPPGTGGITDKPSVEWKANGGNPPKGVITNPPGTGSVDGWSYEAPISNYGNDNYSGGGGNYGGGGSTGSW